MNMVQLLERVIDEGIAAVKADYASRIKSAEHNLACLEGSVAGFEACRGKDASGLLETLSRASKATQEAYGRDAPDRGKKYWYSRCFEAEVEWVCNVVSVVLAGQGLPAIVIYTAAGVMTANKILMSEGCYVPLPGTEREALDFSVVSAM